MSSLFSNEEEEPHLDFSIETVQLEGLVVLQIIKHCRENLPDFVTGQLLGLDVGGTLEITHSFPFPKESSEDSDESAEYQMEMMRCLREVNVDSNPVGWYSCNYLGSFLAENVIDTQFTYQSELKKCVFITYDPVANSNGASLSLKAFRLTKPFMLHYRELKKRNLHLTQEGLARAKLTYKDVFEELPIHIHNSWMIKGLLYDLEEKKPKESGGEFDRLSLSLNPFLEKNLEDLSDNVEDLSSELQKLFFYQRGVLRQRAQQSAFLAKRGAEQEAAAAGQLFKAPAAPNHMDTVLLTNQISNYCDQLNLFSGHSFSKLFLFKGLKDGTTLKSGK